MRRSSNYWIFSMGLGVLAALFVGIQGAVAEDQGVADCAARDDVLGVSRVVEVDTTGGLRFGRAQYKDFSFLKEGEVVLTFDDGPLRRYTTDVLNALEAECTKAIFFMVGRMAVTDPYIVREIDRRGHTIGTHTWSHKNLGGQSRARAIREIELGFSSVSEALGRPVAPFFRFPYLSDPNSMISYLKKRDIGIFSIDVDSKDFRTRSGPAMVSRTLAGIKRNGNKGVLLFHDIQRSTAKGVRGLLRKLKRGGYKIVHLVSKQPVTTLSSYDQAGRKELNRRKKSWSSRPFTDKNVAWPVSTGGLPATEPLAFLTPVSVDRKAKTPKAKSLSDSSSTKEDVELDASNSKDVVTNSKGDQAKGSSLNSTKPFKQKKLQPLQYLDPLQMQIYSD